MPNLSLQAYTLWYDWSMQQTRHKPRHDKKIIIRNTIIGIISFLLLVGGAVIIWLASLQVPDLRAFESREVPKSTQIYDRTGKILLYDFHGDIKRTEIPSTEMATYVKNATVAIEDAEFYTHKGFRLTSFIRAAFVNLTTGSYTQGGSTITQQVVKNAILGQQKTIIRKLKEIVLALKVERQLDKDQILEIYLNEAPYGGTIYGVEEASETYFDKKASELDLAESAYLAAIPQSPSHFSPYGTHLDELTTRKNLVLTRMHDLGYITDQEFQTAQAETVTWKPQVAGGIKAPHFVFFVKDYLENKYGPDILNTGLKVITTLDYDLQKTTEEIVKRRALDNEKTNNASNEAMVGIDPRNGQITMMVGSRDYFDTAIDGQYNIVTAKRQPGSSFKPFVYALAFNKGYTPDTVLFDVPTQFNPSCSAYAGTNNATGCYGPQNYDGLFRGPISIRSALGQSVNVPAVKMLYLVGIQNAIKLANDMGITTLKTAADYGLTLVLGGGEVRLLDMTSAYGVFATGGVRHEPTPILSVTDSTGNVIEQADPNDAGTQVLPKQTALEITDILKDNVARQPEFSPHSALVIDGHDVAVKTGTTNNYKDAWIIGYTPSLVIGGWAGNNDNTPMVKKISALLVAPTWNELMTKILAGKPNEPFEAPSVDPNYAALKPVLRGVWQGGDSYTIDTITGKLATAQTPKETRKEIVTPNVHDILFWVDKSDPTGPKPANPSNDGQFKNWETSVQNWWAVHSNEYSLASPGPAPTSYDDIHTDAHKPIVSILTPQANAVINRTSPLSVSALAQGQYPLIKFDVFLNDSYVGTGNAGTNFTFVPDSTGNVRSTNELKVIGYDTVYNSNEATIPITIQ
jgi:1A family penicillin-binding protein